MDDDDDETQKYSTNIDSVCPVWTDIGFQHYSTVIFDEIAERMKVG